MRQEDRIKRFYEKNGVELPTSQSHELTPDDIKDRVKPINPKNWRLEGNVLIADTDMGPLKQTIPTDYILEGVDSRGLPIFKRIGIT